jgi:uncharacterized membrane protein
MTNAACAILHRDFPAEELIPLSAVRPNVSTLVRRAHPELGDDSLISTAALAPFRAEYVRAVLEEDIGQLSTLEHDVVESLREHEVLASNVDAQFERTLSRGERWADKIADFGGSWRFISLFGAILVVWILINVVLGARAADPYPFILLNLLLSCLAALQAPVIMMSQNRQEAKDRARSEHDYKVNLKAELEIRHLHEKMDFLLKQQAQRLFALQELQIELMEELARRPSPAGASNPAEPPK